MMSIAGSEFFSEGRPNIKMLRPKLEVALAACQRRMNKGAEPRCYRQWQVEARALAAAINILNVIEVN